MMMYPLTTSSSLLSFAFLAAKVAADLPILTSEAADAYNAGAYGNVPNQTFVSSNVTAPLFLVNVWDKNATGSASHILINPDLPHQAASPQIFSSKDLSLVYSDPTFPGVTDVRVQTLNGEPVLTFWAGHNFNGHGDGYGIIMDQQYNVISNLSTKSLSTGADSHEFMLTSDGGAILNNFHPTSYNLTPVGGPANGTLLDCSFEEVDALTGELRFKWTASDHFQLNETTAPKWSPAAKAQGYDWFHMNAVEKTVDGNYLVSSRHLRAVFLVNGTDGSKIWQVGGIKNDFHDLSGGNATNFAYQHDARFANDELTEITLFDNHAMAISTSTPGCTGNCSRAMRIALDFDAMTASLVAEYPHPNSIQAWAEGSYQTLPNGNILTAWGIIGSFVEFSSDGTPVMSIQNGPWTNSKSGATGLYRAYELDWVGKPAWDPSVVVRGSDVFVSWNGATEVDSWVMLGSNSTNVNSFSPITQVPRGGFETAIPLDGFIGNIQIHAMDADGQVLGATAMVSTANTTVATSKQRRDAQMRLSKHPWGRFDSALI